MMLTRVVIDASKTARGLAIQGNSALNSNLTRLVSQRNKWEIHSIPLTIVVRRRVGVYAVVGSFMSGSTHNLSRGYGLHVCRGSLLGQHGAVRWRSLTIWHRLFNGVRRSDLWSVLRLQMNSGNILR